VITNAKSENQSKPAQKGVAKSSTTKKLKEPTEIDEDGSILVTGKNAARRLNNKYNHNRKQEVNQQHNMMSYQAMKMTKMKRVKVMKITKMKRVRVKKKKITKRKCQEHKDPD
jgi:CBS domain containing-hemolysin-like protein